MDARLDSDRPAEKQPVRIGLLLTLVLHDKQFLACVARASAERVPSSTASFRVTSLCVELPDVEHR